jgi:glycosyltransferase involved in cell wall biosynthesis
VLRRLAFAVPGDLATPTGGYAYDRRMIAELAQRGWSVDVINLGAGFPDVDAEKRAAAGRLLAATPAGVPIVIDGLAFGILPEAAALLQTRNPLIALVHLPLALEWGLAPALAERYQATERMALACARRVIVTSAFMARLLMADYALSAERIAIAPPGSDPAAPAQGSSDGIVRLLSVGSLVKGKGHDVLVATLPGLLEFPWRLTIAGDADRDPHYAAMLRNEIASLGLLDRIAIPGAVTPERLEMLYRAADIFVLASHFESYGMAFAQAIAHGLPVIGTNAGAIRETVPESAGILVSPGDTAALARALRRLIKNREARQLYTHGARAAAARLPSWRDSAAPFASAIEASA